MYCIVQPSTEIVFQLSSPAFSWLLFSSHGESSWKVTGQFLDRKGCSVACTHIVYRRRPPLRTAHRFLRRFSNASHSKGDALPSRTSWSPQQCGQKLSKLSHRLLYAAKRVERGREGVSEGKKKRCKLAAVEPPPCRAAWTRRVVNRRWKFRWLACRLAPPPYHPRGRKTVKVKLISGISIGAARSEKVRRCFRSGAPVWSMHPYHFAPEVNFLGWHQRRINKREWSWNFCNNEWS